MGKPQTAIALCIFCCVSLALPGPTPSYAEEPADQAARTCAQPRGTPDDTIASCSALIEAGTLKGRELAAAYAERGFARTLKRSLAEAETDLNEAVKIDPDFAPAYVDRANFWTVSHKPDRAMADAEQAGLHPWNETR